MHIKRYTIASFILIAFMGWIGTFSTQSVSINVLGYTLPTLSIAYLIMIPMAVLYIASLGHMVFYSILEGFRLRKYDADYEKIKKAIADAFLGKEDRNHIFATPRYKLLGSIVDNVIIYPNKLTSTTVELDEDENIRKTLKIIEDIKKGDVVDLKKFSLSLSNDLVIQNNRNRYKKAQLSAEDILSKPEEYTSDFLKEVYLDFVEVSPLYNIENFKTFMTKEALYKILARTHTEENKIEISVESLIKLLETLELDSKDYIEISIELSFGMIPEQRIKLFETLSDTNDEAMEAYLFTLFDLEMIEAADAILEISQPDEYLNFKAYRVLKESHKNFNINLFI